MNTPNQIAAVRDDDFLRKHVGSMLQRGPTHDEIYILLEVAFLMGRVQGGREVGDAIAAKVAA